MRLVTLVDLNAGPLPAVTPPAARNAAWFPIVYQPTPVPPLTGGGSTPVADGVLLEWDAVDSGGAEVIYIIERSPNPAGPWEEVTRTTATRYLYSDGSGQTWYFRIIPTVRGQSGPSEVIEGVPNPVTARLVEIQMTADQATHDATEAQLKAAKALALMGEEYDPARGYVADDVVYLSGKMYRAKQAVPINRPPPNATYWQDVGTVTQAQSGTSNALNQLRTDVDEQGSEFAAAITQVNTGLAGTNASVTQLSQATAASNAIGLVDGGFETTLGWGLASVVDTPNTTLPAKTQYRSDFYRSGTRSLRFDPAISAAVSVFNNSWLRVQSAQKIRLTYWARITGSVPTSAGYIRMSVRRTLSDGTQTYSVGGASVPVTSLTINWTKVTAVYTVPAGDAIHQWAMQCLNDNVNTAVHVDDVSIELIGEEQETARARHTVALDVGGKVSGTVNENDGVRSYFGIVSDIFELIASGSVGMEIRRRGPGWFMRFYASSIQLIIGIRFGTANNLCGWYGPNVGEAAAAKSNGLIWADDNGSAYFGGSLSAGAKKNAFQTTTTVTVGTELVIGPFDTNGTVRSVTISFARQVARVSNAFGSDGFTAGAGDNTATVQVYRKIGTAAETLWQTMPVGGYVDIQNEPDAPDRATSYWAGAMTVNDTSSAASLVTYRAVITAFASQTVTHPGTINTVTTTQTLSMISLEN